MKRIALCSAIVICLVAGAADAAQTTKKTKDQAKQPSPAAGQAIQTLANGVAQQAQAQVVQTLAPQAGAGKGGVADQAKAQAAPSLGEQIRGQAAQTAGTLAASQVNQLLAPVANGNGNANGLGAQVGAQLSQSLGTTLTQSLSGNGNSANAVGDLRKGLGQGAATAIAAPLAQKLGGVRPVDSSTFAGGVQQELQQGLQQGLASEIQKRAGVAGVESGPGLQSNLQTAAKGALSNGAQQQLLQAMPVGQKPLASDLLLLGLNRSGVAVPGATGTFTPPVGSPLAVDSEAMRTGVNILSNNKGQAGLGMKGNLDVGSQKVEISGTLDPNSNADQGKSAGVQIKIGGN
jgi:hypothetical protein